eukprot:g2852.t1
MAPAEIETIVENEHGSAFEVQIKSPGADKTPGGCKGRDGRPVLRTAARLRLESYEKKPLPTLLGSKGPAVPLCEQRADKARQQNEQKKETAERVRLEFQSTADAKRQEMAQQLEKADGLRQGVLASRSKQAGQHYEKVMEKKDTTQQRSVMTAAEARDRLTAMLLQKEELREHQMAERSKRAIKHNEAVADKVQQQKEVMEKNRLKSKALPAAERLMQLGLALKVSHLEADVQQLRHRKEELERENEALAGAACRPDLEQRVKDLQAEVDKLRMRKDELERDQEAWGCKRRDLSTQLAECQAAREKLEDRDGCHAEEYRQHRAESERRAELEKQQADVAKSFAELQGVVSQLLPWLSELYEQRSRLLEEKSAAEDSATKLKSELQRWRLLWTAPGALGDEGSNAAAQALRARANGSPAGARRGPTRASSLCRAEEDKSKVPRALVELEGELRRLSSNGTKPNEMQIRELLALLKKASSHLKRFESIGGDLEVSSWCVMRDPLPWSAPLSTKPSAGLEPQLALKLGPFSCFCLCVERGSLDAGAQLALAQAGVRGEGGVARRSKGSMEEYDYWPPAPVNEEEPMSRLKRPPETPLYVGESPMSNLCWRPLPCLPSDPEAPPRCLMETESNLNFVRDSRTAQRVTEILREVRDCEVPKPLRPHVAPELKQQLLPLIIFSDFELDDLMAIAEVWQWKAVHMGAAENSRPVIVFCCDFKTKDGGEVFEKKILMARLMLGVTMKDIYILVQNPGENQVNWTYFDQKVHPMAPKLFREKQELLAAAAQDGPPRLHDERTTRCSREIAEVSVVPSTEIVDVYFIAPGRGIFAELLNEVEQKHPEGFAQLAQKAHVVMYTGSFNTQGTTIKNEQDFASPTLAQQLADRSELLSASIIAFVDEFQGNLVRPENKSLFRGSELSEDEWKHFREDRRNRRLEEGEEIAPLANKNMQEYAAKLAKDPLFAKVAGYKKSTVNAFHRGSCDAPLCDQVCFIYEWCTHSCIEDLEAVEGHWWLNRKNGFTGVASTAIPEGCEDLQIRAIQPYMKDRSNVELLNRMRSALERLVVYHMSMIPPVKSAADVIG